MLIDQVIVIHSTKFWLNMKKGISANLYQKCLILCSKVLLNVLHNTSSTVLLLRQYTGFQTSLKWKVFLATLAFLIFSKGACIIQQTYEYARDHLIFSWNMLARVCYLFFELKNTNILKSSGRGLKKSELPWQHNFFRGVSVFL